MENPTSPPSVTFSNTPEMFAFLNNSGIGSGLLGSVFPETRFDQAALTAQLVERGYLERIDAGGFVSFRPAGLARDLVGATAHPHAAVWHMQTAPIPEQTYMAFTDEGKGVVFHPTVNQTTGETCYRFTELATVRAVADAIPPLMPISKWNGRPRVWLAPVAILGPVAEGEPLDTDDDGTGHPPPAVRGLIGCGFSEADAENFCKAVASAPIRGALTGFSLGRAGLSLTYLVEQDGTVWTIRMDGESGLALLRRCGSEAAAQQAAAIAAEIAARVMPGSK